MSPQNSKRAIRLTTLLLMLCTLPLWGQQKKNWEYRAVTGLNIGGIIPLPIPGEIERVSSWNPKFNPVVGFMAVRRMEETRRWTYSIGTQIELKGMKASARVDRWRTRLPVDREEYIDILYTGEIEMDAHDISLTFPIQFVYQYGTRSEIHIGGHVGYSLRSRFTGNIVEGTYRKDFQTDKIPVTNLPYDFSKERKMYNIGIRTSYNYAFSQNIYLYSALLWDISPVFPGNFTGVGFKMYNINICLGTSLII